MTDDTGHAGTRAALISLVELSQVKEEAYRAELDTSERAQTGTAEEWAPKEVVAHLAFWKDRQTQRIETMMRGEEPPDGRSWGELNTEMWPEHARLTWDESVARSDQATRDLIAALQRVPPDMLNNPDDPASQANLLITTTLGNTLGHVAEHIANYYRDLGDTERATSAQEDAVRAIVDARLGSSHEGSARYNLACYYALHGQPADAITELREALARRPDLVTWARQDHDLDSLRAAPEYQALVPAEEA
ncbi:MAG TPA: tetratricopeptide repeat protein [Ktedonobacterales bacterium]|nr:tetratricopeptide repeat protein [Ktedonobacterales bacterium]